ncbi:N-acetylmuramoyl-L-alanine amidase CwlD [Candidatus Clostridium radicumherbarum]|uniref:N-acetylmuramoyl-L-alanine amidase CwlD n=1 Tax=Candidatus Clostridium radicumherbarum TaxID=3381662 RepID=A0ABW8TLF9_9CLOT
MMNFRKNIVIGIMLLCILLIPTYTAFAEDYEEVTAEKKVILIDPGHGGYDGGAEGKTGIKEKDINLSISLKLKDMLKAEGFQVFMTREKDEALIDQRSAKYSTKKSQDLANRCKIKKEVNPDLFISIHQNHFPQGQYYGSQVWYSDFKESSILAHLIQGNLIMDLDKSNKRVEKPAKDNYKILRNNDTMPSVLVECGFLSNYNEELKLKNEEYQVLIAKSLTRSIKTYLDEN